MGCPNLREIIIIIVYTEGIKKTNQKNNNRKAVRKAHSSYKSTTTMRHKIDFVACLIFHNMKKLEPIFIIFGTLCA